MIVHLLWMVLSPTTELTQLKLLLHIKVPQGTLSCLIFIIYNHDWGCQLTEQYQPQYVHVQKHVEEHAEQAPSPATMEESRPRGTNPTPTKTLGISLIFHLPKPTMRGLVQVKYNKFCS